MGRKRDWLVIGGSYPGALSAWFKSLYPSHAKAAWSSSGVINAIENFENFDLDIYQATEKSGKSCT
jgi:dipeptidyl aminopeptidase/acylaminoacyl peptidase